MQTKSAEKALRSTRKAQKDQEESSAQIPSGISLRRSPQPSSHSADGAAPLTYTPALPKSQSKFASAVSSQLAEVKAFSDLLAAEGPPLPTFERISHRANLPHDIQEATVAASALAAHQSPAEIHANSLEAAAIFQQLQEAKLAMAEMNKRLEDQQASHRQALLARDQEASSTFHQLQQFLQEQELRRTEETRRLHSHMASLSEAVAQQAITQPEIVTHQRLEGNQSQPIIVHSSSSRSHGRDDAPTSAPQALSSSIDRPTTPTQSFKPVSPSHPASPNNSNPASPAKPAPLPPAATSPARSAPLPSAATDATNLGAEDKALIKQQARAIKQEYAAIAHAQARIAALQQQQPKLTFKVKKPSRETERRNVTAMHNSQEIQNSMLNSYSIAASESKTKLALTTTPTKFNDTSTLPSPITISFTTQTSVPPTPDTVTSWTALWSTLKIAPTPAARIQTMANLTMTTIPTMSPTVANRPRPTASVLHGNLQSQQMNALRSRPSKHFKLHKHNTICR